MNGEVAAVASADTSATSSGAEKLAVREARLAVQTSSALPTIRFEAKKMMRPSPVNEGM